MKTQYFDYESALDQLNTEHTLNKQKLHLQKVFNLATGALSLVSGNKVTNLVLSVGGTNPVSMDDARHILRQMSNKSLVRYENFKFDYGVLPIESYSPILIATRVKKKITNRGPVVEVVEYKIEVLTHLHGLEIQVWIHVNPDAFGAPLPVNSICATYAFGRNIYYCPSPEHTEGYINSIMGV